MHERGRKKIAISDCQYLTIWKRYGIGPWLLWIIKRNEWMANCSRRAEQRRRRPGHQSSNDAMTALREQTLTQKAAVFLRRCPPHDIARSPGSRRSNRVSSNDLEWPWNTDARSRVSPSDLHTCAHTFGPKTDQIRRCNPRVEGVFLWISHAIALHKCVTWFISESCASCYCLQRGLDSVKCWYCIDTVVRIVKVFLPFDRSINFSFRAIRHCKILSERER